ncbi:MAG: NAD(P)H-hydrate dehydratase [Bacteroidales bacterium]|nr:NAD(P)H-hydrate dehydratase [Bacteroidales bacterium]
MKIFHSEQVREIDAYTIEHEPISSIDLMERASVSFSNWFCRKFDISKEVIVFAGPGNNGGDGLAIARILRSRNFLVSVYLIKLNGKLSSDCETNIKRLKSGTNSNYSVVTESSPIPKLKKGVRIIDAIFGSGLSRPVNGFPAEIIKNINKSVTEVISVDIPSGLFGQDNRKNNHEAIIKADYTITFEFPFLSFFFYENKSFVGNWKVIPIGIHKGVVKDTKSAHFLVSKDFARGLLKDRDSFSHKGNYGHALIVAGSYGMMGAAVLAVKACLRGGVGLVTSHLPRFGYDIMQSSLPEALISIDQSDIIFTEVELTEKFNAIGIGPGLNTKSNTSKGVLRLLSNTRLPMIIDADAINILSDNKQTLNNLSPQTILSPHPGEFDRLAGKSANDYERHEKQVELSRKYGIIIILKGRYTIISLQDGSSFINSTGNSGLATGGSGDVLTGLITALLAQNYKPSDAAILGVYLHGLAADLALKNQSQESLLPSDVIENLGKAFTLLLPPRLIRHPFS